MTPSALSFLFRCCRPTLAFLLVGAVSVVGTPAYAQRRTPENANPREQRQPNRSGEAALAAGMGILPRNKVTFTAEREAAALTFVRQHRPELVEVLENLKTAQPSEYQRAICDLFWTSEMLTAVRQEDRQRYDYALRSWQWEAKAHLLAAQLAGAPTNSEALKVELQQAVEQLVKAQLEESAYAVQRQEAQLRRAQERHKRLESRREELVRERLGTILKTAESPEPSASPRGDTGSPRIPAPSPSKK